MPTDTDKEIIQQHSFQMINVGQKQTTLRRAVAQGCITVGKQVFDLIQSRQLPKGDALMLAEVAGIMGAKKTAELVPLCHPLGLDHVAIKTELNTTDHSITVFCEAVTSAKTGVEMEALTGVNTALLTIYDLSKMITSALNISDIKLLLKTGGKQGIWMHPDGIPKWLEPAETKPQALKDITTTITTVSDRATSGEYSDESGPVLDTLLTKLGANIIAADIIADEQEEIARHIKETIAAHSPRLFVLTGGTGMGPRDVTPDALEQVCEKMVSGLGELLRHDGANKYTSHAWLSRCTAGIYKQTLIISLPGRPKAVKEGIEMLEHLLPHALAMVSGEDHV